MLKFPFQSVRNVLCLGAHPDDIEIGCGGAMLQLLTAAPHAVRVRWIVFSGDATRTAEAQESASEFLELAGESEIIVKDFRDRFFPADAEKIKQAFDEEGRSFSPDLIFTHRRQDAHQDHRIIAELTWNTFRNHLIMEYEIPKYEGDLGHPNVFVPLTASTLQRKVDLLLKCFQSQSARHWFSEETFRALPRLRGIESASDTGYAEAFHVSKLQLETRCESC